MRALSLSRLQVLGLMILAATLPFELKAPLVSFGPIAITNVEAILYLVIMLWLISTLYRRQWHWSIVHSAVLVWLGVQFCAAVFAPLERAAALKFALRSAGGAWLFFIAAAWIRTSRRAAWIMAAIALGAVLSALAGWLEVGSSAAQTALLIFKTQATLVGDQLRASGTFQYANTAAMYWEATWPILIAAGARWSIARGQRRWLGLALIGGLIGGEAIILSSSRAALVSAALALGIMIVSDRVVDRAGHIRSGLRRPAVLSLIGLVVLIGVQLFVNPLFTARLRSEGDASWFQAVVRSDQAHLTAFAGETLTQTIGVTNTSVRTWPAAGVQAVHVSYHWIQPGTRRVLILDGARTALPHDLAPGKSVTVSAVVDVPAVTGTLLLQWDMVQEDVTWFGERGSPVAEVKVNVTPAPQVVKAEPLPVSSALQEVAPPSRAALWRAGWQMWLNYPLLGVGPDNFRHVYGPYLGQMKFDDRLTANSWIVEVLATTGLIGLLASGLVLMAMVLVLRRYWHSLANRDARLLAVGLSVALLAFLMHGLVDYFMEFTPTYGLFWLIAGTLVSLLTGTHDVELASPVDRV